MDYQDIVDYAVDHTWVNITYDKCLKYAKKRRNQIVNIIKSKVDEYYFNDIYFTDLIAWQNEYTIPQSNATDWGVLLIERPEAKLKSTDDYRSLLKSQTKPWYATDYISDKEYNPFYQIRWGSIFIYPTPTENITNGLRIEAKTNLPDITTSSIEADMYGEHTELRDFIQLIADWVVVDLYASTRNYTDKQYAEAEYNTSIQEMIKTIWGRSNIVWYETQPDLSHLE